MNKIKVFGIFFSMLLLCISCENKEDEDPQYGIPINNHGCNEHKTNKSSGDLPDTLSCISYNYDTNKNQLNIEHKNTVFNCCVDLLLYNEQIKNDTIFIKEMEHNGQCNCLCLYDIEMKVENIKTQKYILKITEAYAEQENPFIFEIRLDSIISGRFCLQRYNYPYGITKN